MPESEQKSADHRIDFKVSLVETIIQSLGLFKEWEEKSQQKSKKEREGNPSYFWWLLLGSSEVQLLLLLLLVTHSLEALFDLLERVWKSRDEREKNDHSLSGN